MSRSSQKSQRKSKGKNKAEDGQDRWAWEVLDSLADYIEANAGNAKAIEAMLYKNADKIIKAILVLIRPEHRLRVVEWIERVSKAV